jgi:hypothetical protein
MWFLFSGFDTYIVQTNGASSRGTVTRIGILGTSDGWRREIVITGSRLASVFHASRGVQGQSSPKMVEFELEI